MFQILVFVSLFVCFASLAGGVALILRNKQESGQVEDRLKNLTSNNGRGTASTKMSTASVLAKPLEDMPNQLEELVSKYLNLSNWLNQAGIKMSVSQFVGLCLGMGAVATGVYVFFAPMKVLAPVVFACVAGLPFFWLIMKRKKRLRVFSSQLADAMDVLSRALRSGYSLPAGFQLVGQQASEPLGPEFMRCFEEQNLGISLEQSIRNMVERIPNLDLQFFATAVILQRQTGGDLAEILDKISHLIRERFKIWGQIQALTGEGRLSGLVLLALPPGLFMFMLRINYDYIMMLFTEPLGQKMLAAGIILQILGAVTIKKIITIKV